MKTVAKQILRKAGVTRLNVAAARMCCERNVIAAAGKAHRRWIGRVLCYHSIGQPQWGTNDVTPAQFRRHIELALEAGYTFVPASEIARTGGKAKELALTFDDGLRTVFTEAAPILREYGLPWTFFPVSDWSEHRDPWTDGVILTWREIEALLAGGAEMGSHSATHPDFATLDRPRITDELGGSRDLFEKRLGFAPEAFAIPFGQSANWNGEADRIARDAGYSVLYAQAEHTRPAGTVARTFVTKFDGDRIFRALLKGKFDYWEEWV